MKETLEKSKRMSLYHRFLMDVAIFLNMDEKGEALNLEYANRLLLHREKLDSIGSKAFIALVILTAANFLYICGYNIQSTLSVSFISNISGIPELISLGSSLLFLYLCVILSIHFVIENVADRIFYRRNPFAYQRPAMRAIYLLQYFPYGLLATMLGVRNIGHIQTRRYMLGFLVIGVGIIGYLFIIPVIVYLTIQLTAIFSQYNSPKLPDIISHSVAWVSILNHILGIFMIAVLFLYKFKWIFGSDDDYQKRRHIGIPIFERFEELKDDD